MKQNEKENSLLQQAIRAMFRPEEEKLKKTAKRGRKAASVLMAAAMIVGSVGTASAYTWNVTTDATRTADVQFRNGSSGGSSNNTFDVTVADNATGTVTGDLLDFSFLGIGYNGNVNKYGLGTLELNGANRYSGPTTVHAGTLVLGGSNSMGSSVTVLTDAVLDIQKNAGLGSGNVILNGGTANLNDTVAGSFALSKLRGTGGTVKAADGVNFTTGRITDIDAFNTQYEKYGISYAGDNGSLVVTGNTGAVFTPDISFTSLTTGYFTAEGTIQSGGGLHFDDAQFSDEATDWYTVTAVGNRLTVTNSSAALLGGGIGGGFDPTVALKRTDFHITTSSPYVIIDNMGEFVVDLKTTSKNINLDFSGLDQLDVTNNTAGGDTAFAISILSYPVTIATFDLPGIGGGMGFMSAKDININLGDNANVSGNTASLMGGNVALVSLDLDINNIADIGVKGKVSLTAGDNVSINNGKSLGYGTDNVSGVLDLFGGLDSLLGNQPAGPAEDAAPAAAPITIPQLGIGLGGGIVEIGTSVLVDVGDGFSMSGNRAGSPSQWVDPLDPDHIDGRTTGNFGIGAGLFAVATDGPAVFKVGDGFTIDNNVATSVGGAGFLLSMGADENGKGGAYVKLGDNGTVSNNKATGAVNVASIVKDIPDLLDGVMGNSNLLDTLIGSGTMADIDKVVGTVSDFIGADNAATIGDAITGAIGDGLNGIVDAIDGKGIAMGGGFAQIATGDGQNAVLRIGSGNLISGNQAGSDGTITDDNPTGIVALGIGGFESLISATGDAKVISDGGNTYLGNSAYNGIGGAISAISGTGDAKYISLGAGETFQYNNAGMVGGAVSLMSATGDAIYYGGTGTTEFTGNKANWIGGGLAAISATGNAVAAFDDLVLTDNRTSGVGGGVAVIAGVSLDGTADNGQARVIAHTLNATGNQGDVMGGALAVVAGYGDAALSVHGGTNLDNNKTDGIGGGIAVVSGYGIEEVKIHGFTGNALIVLDGPTTMTNNHAVGVGGGAAALAVVGDATIGVLGEGTFTDNSAKGLGGALAATSVTGNAEVTLLNVTKHATFERNSSDVLGGAIAATTITGDANVNFGWNADFIDNRSGGVGGAVAATTITGDANINAGANIYAADNSANGLGGAFAATTITGDANVNVLGLNAEFDRNSAIGVGGAVAATSVTGNAAIRMIGDVSFTDNSAVGVGGALAATSGDNQHEAATAFNIHGEPLFTGDALIAIGGKANFQGNDVVGIGGGAAATALHGDATIGVIGVVTADDNSAEGLGGVFAATTIMGDALIEMGADATFTNNRAGGIGGVAAATAIDGDATINFFGQMTANDNEGGGLGGVLAATAGNGNATVNFAYDLHANNNFANGMGAVVAATAINGDAGINVLGHVKTDNNRAIGLGGVMAATTIVGDAEVNVLGYLEADNNRAEGLGGVIAATAVVGDADVNIGGKAIVTNNRAGGLGGVIAATAGEGNATVNFLGEMEANNNEAGGLGGVIAATAIDGNAAVNFAYDLHADNNFANGLGGVIAATAVNGDADINILGHLKADGNRAEGLGGVLAATAVNGNANVNVFGLSDLTNNSAGGLGGAIAATSVVGDSAVRLAAIQNMTGNSAGGLGGVVAATAGKGDALIVIDGLTNMQNNTAGGLGGALAATSLHGNGYVYLNGAVNATDNSAGGLGGVIAATSAYSDSDVATIMALNKDAKIIGNAVIDIDGAAHMANNTAGGLGGALAATAGYGNAVVDIDGISSFHDNSAGGLGGAIAATSVVGDAAVYIKSLESFTNNSAGGLGGAIAVTTGYGNGYIGIDGLANFVGNKAGGLGGAIAMTSIVGDVFLKIDAAENFMLNSAGGLGGAIALTAGKGSAIASIEGPANFALNSAGGLGGAIAVTTLHGPAAVYIDGPANFLGNTAGGLGGAIAVTAVYNAEDDNAKGDAIVDIDGLAHFSYNMAGGLGGAIAATTGYGDALVRMNGVSSFHHNSAGGLGGAIAATSLHGNATVYVAEIENFTFNTAGGLGGAIAATSIYGDASIFVDGLAHFANNTAGGLGGALAATAVKGDALVAIEAVASFHDNTAGGLGGAIAATAADGNATVAIGVAENFSNNTADGMGGAIAASTINGDATVYVEGLARFNQNHADGLGGAIAASAVSGDASVYIGGLAVLSENTATGIGGAIAATAIDGDALVQIDGAAFLTKNSAYGFGGAIAASSLLDNAVVSIGGDAKFVDNFSHGFGGAVAVTAGDDALFNVDGSACFLNNETLGLGGGLSVIAEDNAQVRINGKATFTNNEAVGVTLIPQFDDILGYGGGMAVLAGDGDATVYVGGESDFYANKANGMGGGAAISSVLGNAYANFGDDATFRGNTADGFLSIGGGLAVNALKNASAGFFGLATITDNHSNAFGGGAAVNSFTADAQFFTGDGARILRNTALGYGGGIAVNGRTAIISLGSDTLVKDNSAVGFGGGLVANGIDYALVGIGSDSNILNNRATFDIVLLGDGGGVWTSHDMYVGGNTLFSGNLAGGQGGAAYLAGFGKANLAVLDTELGDIAFTGNKQGVDFGKRGNAKGGEANSLYLVKDTTVRVLNDNNVFFDDAIDSSCIGGNDFEKYGKGYVQFVGDSFLNRDGKGGTINVYEGTLRLAEGASLSTLGKTSAFNLKSNTAIAGTGTITARNQYLQGYLTPDADRFAIPDGIGTADAVASRTVVDPSLRYGMLTFDGNVKLDGATFVVEISKNPIGRYPIGPDPLYSGKPIYATDQFHFTGDIEFVGEKSKAIIDGPDKRLDKVVYVHDVIISDVKDLSTGDVRKNLDEIFNDDSKALTWQRTFYHDDLTDPTLNFMDLGFYKSSITNWVDTHCYTDNKHNMAELVDDLFATGKVDWLEEAVYNISYEDRALICEGVKALLGGEILADAQTLALWSPWKKTNNRLYELYDNARRGCDPCGAANSCGSYARSSKWNVWFEGYYGSENVANDGNAYGYDATRGGMMVGADNRFNSRFTLGAAFGYGSPRLSNEIGKVEADDYTFGLYSQVRLTDKIYSNLFLGYGHQDNDYTRYNLFRNTNTYASDSMYASVEFFRPIHRKRATYFPLIAFDYQGVWSEGFRERVPGNLGLVYDGGDFEQTMFRVGVNAKLRWNDRLNLRGRLQYGAVIGGEVRGEVNTAFALNPGESRTLLGVNRGRHLLDAGIGAEYYAGPKKLWHLFVDYDIVASENSTGHMGTAGIARTW